MELRWKSIFILSCSAAGTNTELSKYLEQRYICKVIIHVNIEFIGVLGEALGDLVDGN